MINLGLKGRPLFSLKRKFVKSQEIEKASQEIYKYHGFKQLIVKTMPFQKDSVPSFKTLDLVADQILAENSTYAV
jgi:hypothetical protein